MWYVMSIWMGSLFYYIILFYTHCGYISILIFFYVSTRFLLIYMFVVMYTCGRYFMILFSVEINGKKRRHFWKTFFFRLILLLLKFDLEGRKVWPFKLWLFQFHHLHLVFNWRKKMIEGKNWRNSWLNHFFDFD